VLADNVLQTMWSVSTPRLTATHIRHDRRHDRRTNFVIAGATREQTAKPKAIDRRADRRINFPAAWK
jgi:hypothetical protein